MNFQFAIQAMTRTLTVHLDREQVKVCYSNVSIIQFFVIQIPAIINFCCFYHTNLLVLHTFDLIFTPGKPYWGIICECLIITTTKNKKKI